MKGGWEVEACFALCFISLTLGLVAFMMGHPGLYFALVVIAVATLWFAQYRRGVWASPFRRRRR